MLVFVLYAVIIKRIAALAIGVRFCTALKFGDWVPRGGKLWDNLSCERASSEVLLVSAASFFSWKELRDWANFLSECSESPCYNQIFALSFCSFRISKSGNSWQQWEPIYISPAIRHLVKNRSRILLFLLFPIFLNRHNSVCYILPNFWGTGRKRVLSS